MRRLGLAALAALLAIGPARADFRSEFVEVIAQVGARTVSVLVEKRAELSGALVLNVIGSAIYDQGKEWIGRSKKPEDTPIRSDSIWSGLLKACAEGRHNAVCPARTSAEDAIAKETLRHDLGSFNSLLQTKPSIVEGGTLSKPAVSDALKTWLNSPAGQDFLRRSQDLHISAPGVRFVAQPRLENLKSLSLPEVHSAPTIKP